MKVEEFKIRSSTWNAERSNETTDKIMLRTLRKQFGIMEILKNNY